MKWRAAICLALASLALSMPATALCAEPPGFAQGFEAAPLVFTGTVLSTESFDRVAHVEVETIWKGAQIAAEVTVFGTPDPFPGGGFMSASSLDRTFQMGVRYVFFPVSLSDPYGENSCTLTQPLTLDLEQTLIVLADGVEKQPIPIPPVQQTNAEPTAIASWVLPSAVGAVAAGLIVLVLKRRPKRVEVEGFRTSGDREVGLD